MYPYWLEIGSFKLPTFGPMVVLGFLAAHFFIKKELQRKGIDGDLAGSIITAGILGGLGGAKLYFVLFELPSQATWGQFFGAVFSGSGLTFYGGFVIGAAVVIWVIRRSGAPLGATTDAMGIGLAIGYAIGRIGCQLAGDGDYGIPTDVPWGMAYPDGVAPTFQIVHPTPVYETLMGLAVFGILWGTRKRIQTPGMSLFLYFILSGLARFSVEFLRLNPRVFLGYSAAQIISAILVLVGAGGIIYLRRGGRGGGGDG